MNCRAINFFSRRVSQLLPVLSCALILLAIPAEAATFTGNARLESAGTDSTLSLSWDPSKKALTAACWFKIAVPSDFVFDKDMVIMVNSRSATATSYAYAVYLSSTTGNLEFRSKGPGGEDSPKTILPHPQLERWYHVAAVRDGPSLRFYVDGRLAHDPGSNTTLSGDASSTDGLTIGAWGNDKYFRGEIQEVAIYNSALSQGENFIHMTNGATLAEFPALRGYYKLPHAATPAENLKNYAESPAVGADSLTNAGSVMVTFPETDAQGEQSAFDLRKNNGLDAISSLGGSFGWEHEAILRSTPGIPFEFSFGYSSSIAFSGQATENGRDIYQEDNVMGAGWMHSFQTRLLSGVSYLAQFPGSGVYYGLLDAGGGLETWVRKADGSFENKHKEYRGEIKEVQGGSFVDWITPDRTIIRFHHPINSPLRAAGKIESIRDLNDNKQTFNYHPGSGRLVSINDSAGGIWTFDYPSTGEFAGLLTSVSGPFTDAAKKWTVTFTYQTAAVDGNPKKLLKTKSISGPAGYSLPVRSALEMNVPGSTQWEFFYDAKGRLQSVSDPRGFSEVEVTYDNFGRKTKERDARGRFTAFKYNIPSLRQLTTTEFNSGETVDLTRDRMLVETFDRKLRLISHTDPMGFTASYKYDDAGNVIETTDARGATTTMTYDSRSNLLSSTNALQQTTRWVYPQASDLPASTNGHLRDGILLNKPVKEIRPATLPDAPNGWENRFFYDIAGNLLRHEDDLKDSQGNPATPLAQYTYGPRGLVTSSRDARLNETTFAYDPVTLLLSSRTIAAGKPEAATWTYSYTELGWPRTETNPLQQTTTISYNVNGQVVATTDALSRTFTRVWDANGNPVAESDGKGALTTYTYTAADERETMQTRPLGAGGSGFIWQYGYSGFSELEQTETPSFLSTEPDGTSSTGTLISRKTYDRNSRLVVETAPDNKATTFEYDASGNQTAMVDRAGQRWEKAYDALNRVIAERDPEGNVRRTTYDAAGRVLVISSPNGFPSTHSYDGRGRLTLWKDAEGFEWRYFYDGAGNIEKITDAEGGDYVMTYGPRNERLTERNQDGKQWSYTYDALVRLQSQINPPGQGAGPGGGPVQRTLHYDAAGRLESVIFNTGRINSLGYDDNNNVRFVTRTQPPQAGQPGQPAVTTVQLEYDALDRLTASIDTFGKTVRYGYDALSRVVAKTYPGGKILTQSHDRLSRLTRLSFPGPAGALDCTFTWDDAGRLKARTYPNGVTQSNDFDSAGRIEKLDYAGSATPPVALSYAYDRNGNKTGGSEFGTAAWKAGDLNDYDETAAFKPDGKLISRTDALSSRDFSYAYDAAGNMTRAIIGSSSAPVESYDITYDEDNRTASITWDTGLTEKRVANRYDGLGRRISRDLDGAVTRYVLDLTGDMERTLCDTDANGVIRTWYVHGPDLCFKLTDTGAVTCYHADAQGNIIRTTSGTGATVNEYAYTPYGRNLLPQGAVLNDPTDPYRFVGSQGVMLEFPAISSSNLYFMRARYYSAEAAVFLATDPVKNIGPGWKPAAYLYASNKPISQADPKGEEWILLTLTATAVLTVEIVRLAEGVIRSGADVAATIKAQRHGEISGEAALYSYGSNLLNISSLGVKDESFGLGLDITQEVLDEHETDPFSEILRHFNLVKPAREFGESVSYLSGKGPLPDRLKNPPLFDLLGISSSSKLSKQTPQNYNNTEALNRRQTTPPAPPTAAPLSVKPATSVWDRLSTKEKTSITSQLKKIISGLQKLLKKTQKEEAKKNKAKPKPKKKKK